MISIFQYLIKDEKLLKNTLFHGLVFEPYLLFGNVEYAKVYNKNIKRTMPTETATTPVLKLDVFDSISGSLKLNVVMLNIQN